MSSAIALQDRSAVMGDWSPVRDDSRAVQPQVRWTCAATNPQAERWAEQNLRRSGYATYLPLVLVRKRDRVIRSLWRDVLVPLFPGYLFVALTDQDPWSPIRYSPGVRKLCIYGNRLQYARAGDVEALQASEDLRRELPQETATWRVGQSCAIGGGVFEGAEAVVSELRGDKAVVSLVNCGMLSRALVSITALVSR